VIRKMSNKIIIVSVPLQKMTCYENDVQRFVFDVSTAKNGVGERINSQCTPRGWHKIHAVIGMEHEKNSVFVAREWTGEIYNDELARQNPDRDWILTRIIQLDGLEPGRNRGGEVDSLKRYIYIHGTPDSTPLGKPGSHGCIRMNNKEIIDLAQWVTSDTLVYIQ